MGQRVGWFRMGQRVGWFSETAETEMAAQMEAENEGRPTQSITQRENATSRAQVYATLEVASALHRIADALKEK